MKTVRILVADDHELVRHGLAKLLSAEPGWEVVAEAEDGREAIDLANRMRPDVAVIDVTMPEINGIDATREITRSIPGIKVVILTMHFNEQLVMKLLDAGASAYVLKTDARNELVTAIAAVLEDSRFFTTAIPKSKLETMLARNRLSKTPGQLTRREQEILKLLTAGKSNKEAAADLNISLRTVEKHRANIMHKLHVGSLGDLVHYAIGAKLV
ncbi:MAG: response regulator transcription factor [Acidobacteriota bacterium]|nr:response regulator transcription factor [Acidobacteriota bacterium]